MPNLFSSAPGRVAQITSSALPMMLSIGNLASAQTYAAWRGFSVFKSIITGIGIQQQSGFQMLHTLNEHIYIYSFGERGVDLSINGLAFMANCEDAANAQGFLVAATGLEHVVNFYKFNRLSAFGLPVDVSIGTTIGLHAFLVGLNVGLTDPATGIAQFTMMFKAPPLL